MSGTKTARGRTLQPRLAVQLALVLSIAILPLGLISVYQTYSVLKERQSLSTAALLEETQRAVSDSREVIRTAVGAAETLAILVSASEFTDDACTAAMAQIAEKSRWILFAGYRDLARGLVCGSKNLSPDEDPLTALPAADLAVEDIGMTPLAILSGVATVNITVPVLRNGTFLGTVWIAVPAEALNDALARAAPDVDLVLFQSEGEIIATEEYADDRRSVLPKDRTLEDLALAGRQTFRGENRKGLTRDFAIAPIVDGRVYALGSWEPREFGLTLPTYKRLMALYFPIVMWVVAIVVAYVGVQRLVIRHVRRLRSWMRLYSSGQAGLENARLDNAPEELEVVAEAFRAMTTRLSEQERLLEADLKEKTLLLREVHHRVKNNLQLISSMLNMQIRATDSPEAKRLLRRVQDRVMALSAIHRYLYLARKLSSLRADELLEEIIQQLVVVGTLEDSGHQIRVSTALDPVEISPDQSVPLSLLATEAAINAVKYCGATGDAPAWIDIALRKADGDNISLSVVNSRAADTGETTMDMPKGSGLGARLIQSFVAQLNGTREVIEHPDRYEMHVVFPLSWAQDGEDDTSD
ncbi:sensor histidine kinase [Meridianimarinicoccus sp. MJW13]|uniref:sensor histidine kinase n=1 Tax=Meridianimarinicoccus sp. MJW13 TaxID=2720031 RepID=UPI00186651F9|nr:sensor histidine kinase [Fluviibacterium sp. MJW13]